MHGTPTSSLPSGKEVGILQNPLASAGTKVRARAGQGRAWKRGGDISTHLVGSSHVEIHTCHSSGL